MPDDDVSLDERFAGHSQAKAAAQALVAYWQALSDAEPGNDEETAAVGRWKARTDRALAALRTVDPVLFDGPLASNVKQNADAAANHLTSNGISGPNTPDTADTLHRTLLTLVALPPGGRKARPLAHVTDEAVDLVTSLREKVNSLTAAVKELQEERNRLATEMQQRIEDADSTVAAHLNRLDSDVTDEIQRVTNQLEEDREAFVKARQNHDDEAEGLISALKQKVGLAADGSLSVGYENAAKAEQELRRSPPDMGCRVRRRIRAARDWSGVVERCELGLVRVRHRADQACGGRCACSDRDLPRQAVEWPSVGGVAASPGPARTVEPRRVPVGTHVGAAVGGEEGARRSLLRIEHEPAGGGRRIRPTGPDAHGTAGERERLWLDAVGRRRGQALTDPEPIPG